LSAFLFKSLKFSVHFLLSFRVRFRLHITRADLPQSRGAP
jgi:hypothetical protein